MKVFYRRLYKTFALIVTGLVIVLLLGIGIIQTSWGRSKFTSHLLDIAKQNHVELKIKETKGFIPSNFIFESVEFDVSDSMMIKIDHLSIQLSLLQLFFREIAFTSFDADGVYFIEKKTPKIKETKPTKTKKRKRLNYGLFLKSFEIKNVHFPNLNQVILSLEGKAKLERGFKAVYVNTTLKRKGYKNSSIHIIANGSKTRNSLHSKLYINSDTTKAFSEFIDLPFDMDCSLKILSKTNFKDFVSWIYNRDNNLKVTGKTSGIISHIDLSKDKKSNNVFENDWKVFSFFQLTNKGEVRFSDIFCKNDYFTIKGDSSFNKTKLEFVDIELFTRDLTNFPLDNALSGFVKAYLKITPQENSKKIALKVSGEDLKIQDKHIRNFSTHINAVGNMDVMRGNAKSNLIIEGRHLDGTVNFSYQDKTMHLTDLVIITPSGEIEGNADINPRLRLIGSINAHFDNMNLLKLIFPHIDMESRASIAASFSEGEKNSEKFQLLHLSASVSEFHFHELFSKEATLTIDARDVFSDMKGTLEFTSPNSSIYEFTIDSLSFKTSNFFKENPYELICLGTFKDPFSLSSFGIWSYEKDTINLSINKLIGKIFTHPFDIASPIHCTFSDDIFLIDDFEIKFSNNPLYGKILLQKDKKVDIRFESEAFPLDFLSLNTLQLTTRGYGKLDANLSYDNDTLKSNLSLDIAELKAYPMGGEKPFTLSGNVAGHIDKNFLKLKANLDYKEHEKLFIDASLPVEMSFSPFAFSFNSKFAIEADASFNGRLEELLDFFDTGSHKVEGNIDAKLKASGSFASPHLEGYVNIENGVYENYFTGTYLQQIHGKFKANDAVLAIEELKGKDPKDGFFEATGKIHFNLDKNFPFSIETKFNELVFLQTDLITATAKGNLNLSGTTKSADAKGDITITSADLVIPEKLPHDVIHMPVKFIPKKDNDKKGYIEPYAVYPLNLNIDIFAPDNFKITGQGVNSEWKGELHLKGSYDNMVATGDLYLLKGEFLFSGHSFDLIHGELTFPGKLGDMPNLNLSGKTSIRGTTIVATLQGPINRPTLNFSSSPALPLSSIISLIIFGQEVSELTALQAVQLVSSMTAVSGTGTDILEKTRKTLGIDRLAIVSTPATTIEEPEKTALQVGKYVMKGVMVTLSQGMDQDTSNIIVEVDLTHGFIFQAETQREEEQGKFSLKWNFSY